MKKYVYSIIAALTALMILSSCCTTLPVENSSVAGSSAPEAVSAQSEEISVSPASSAEEPSAELSSEEPVSEEESSMPDTESSEEIPEESSEASSELSETSEESAEESSEISEEESIEESSEESVEESSEESLEESSEEPPEESSAAPEVTVGPLTKPYLAILDSGSYRIRISETRTVGGEALPYTVTAYHKGDTVYYEVEESYGSKTEYLRKDGKFITLDTFSQKALVSADEGEQFEKTLWTGGITLTDSGSVTLFETEYKYESYKDETGFEFTLLYDLEKTLERYRSYDGKLKDTIVISISISGDISDGIFDIPSGYTIIED